MSKAVQRIFSDVPRTYELVNHVLTFGLDILWRRKAAEIASAGGGKLWLDICSGTGEMAIYLCRLAGKDTKVVAADFSLPMLRKIKEKTQPNSRPGHALPGADGRLLFTLGDATCLPFPDSSFDLITLSLGTRNLNVRRDNLLRAFREFHRILKPGGRFINLETSQPASGILRKLFHIYIRLMVRPLGSLLSGSKSGYAYLSYTVPRFYGPGELAEILRQAGFVQVTFRPLNCGIAAIHRAVKSS